MKLLNILAVVVICAAAVVICAASGVLVHFDFTEGVCGQGVSASYIFVVVWVFLMAVYNGTKG